MIEEGTTGSDRGPCSYDIGMVVCDVPLAPVERRSVYGKQGGVNLLMRSRYALDGLQDGYNLSPCNQCKGLFPGVYTWNQINIPDTY